MKLYDDLTQFNPDSSNLKNSLIYTTIVNLLISFTHLILLCIVISAIVYLATDTDFNISPYLFIFICIAVFAIFVVISLWLHYQMKLKFSQCFKAVIILPVLRQLFKSTTYSQTCDCERIIRIPNIMNNKWRSARINDYFDGYNEDYERDFEFFDFQLFMADGGSKSAVYKGHLLVMEMPWRLDNVTCRIYHPNMFNFGNTGTTNFTAFEIQDFAQKFVVSCQETHEDFSNYMTQKQQNQINASSAPHADSDTSQNKKTKKAKSATKKTTIHTEENLIGEFESERKIVISSEEYTESSEISDTPSLPSLPSLPKLPTPQEKYVQKNIIYPKDILTRQFAESVLTAEKRLNKDLYIYVCGDRMFVNLKTNADILESHTMDFIHSKDTLEKRVIDELLPIVDMISIGK